MMLWWFLCRENAEKPVKEDPEHGLQGGLMVPGPKRIARIIQ